MAESIYLDNAATTRVAPEVADVATRCMTEDFGNPASAHHHGIAAERWVKKAREQVLAAIGDPHGDHGDLYFTSGGTESDALGVIGPARARRGRKSNVVVGVTEHPAVRESAALLEGEGFSVRTAGVAEGGAVSAEKVADTVDGDTAVAALMLVNNEIGVINPIADAARAAREKSSDIHFHCDAVQALGKIPVSVVDLGVDSAAFAAHKIHGPKGVGALWVKKGARITPLWAGGGQQNGVRSGTLNVPGIAAMGCATELATADLADTERTYREFGDMLLAAAKESGADVRVNGEGAERAPHVISIAVRGVPAEPLLHVLESRGVLVSAGSACSERDRKPSPVLTAIGLPKEFGTVRLSLGRENTKEEIARAADILRDAIRSFL